MLDLEGGRSLYTTSPRRRPMTFQLLRVGIHLPCPREVHVISFYFSVMICLLYAKYIVVDSAMFCRQLRNIKCGL